MKSLIFTLTLSFVSLTAAAQSEREILICAASQTYQDASKSIEQVKEINLYIVELSDKSFISIDGLSSPLRLTQKTNQGVEATYDITDSHLKATLVFVSGESSTQTELVSVKIGDVLVAASLVKDQAETDEVTRAAGEGYSCSRGIAKIK